MIALPESDSESVYHNRTTDYDCANKYKRRSFKMKKLLSLFFAAAMMFSVVFISEAISPNSPFAAQAQVTVKRKNRGLASRVAGGGRYVYRKSKQGGYAVYRGGKYVGRASVRGGKYVGGKTVSGTKYVGSKTVSGTKYVGGKTVKTTKTVSRKTVKGTKSVFSKTKKVVTGN